MKSVHLHHCCCPNRTLLLFQDKGPTRGGKEEGLSVHPSIQAENHPLFSSLLQPFEASSSSLIVCSRGRRRREQLDRIGHDKHSAICMPLDIENFFRYIRRPRFRVGKKFLHVKSSVWWKLTYSISVRLVLWLLLKGGGERGGGHTIEAEKTQKLRIRQEFRLKLSIFRP